MKTTKESFGRTAAGAPVDLYTLTNSTTLQVQITNYGGIITSILAPDRSGVRGEVTLGFETLAQYMAGNPFFGALVGRHANRIANGRFTLNGVPYALAQNNGNNHLHGGLIGFDKVVWQAEETPGGLRLTYRSAAGEENYPGQLDVTVLYTLTETNGLRIDYTAVADADTIVHLTNHTYFNLAGKGDILGHEVTLHADRFTPIDTTLIPTGELRPVEGTPFDFPTPHAIGERIDQPDEQLQRAGGYDHNWVLNGSGGLAMAASVAEPASGRVLTVSTTQPGVQFYTGNFLDGTLIGRGGALVNRRTGFCLETQHFPDAPNQPHFPSTVLRAGEAYAQSTVFEFSVR